MESNSDMQLRLETLRSSSTDSSLLVPFINYPTSMSDSAQFQSPSEAPESNDNNELGVSDSFIQSQIAILQEIERENELRRSVSAGPKCAEFDLPPVAFVSVPSAPCVITSSEKDDLNDMDVMNAQRRLLERFQRKKELEQTKQACNKEGSKSESDSTSSKELGRSAKNQIVRPCLPPTGKTNPSLEHDEVILPKDELRRSVTCPDHYAKIGRRKFVVRGTDQTYKAIESGASTIINCLACKRALQVPASAKAVYCTCCHHISNIEGMSNTSV
ncbi:hypothetical protein MPSEU_000845500 [Mayamaea pseudoterrestris]|nr:hypothetical protein MPSEU_000845500 [Mayamaea pseudoterrestris]